MKQESYETSETLKDTGEFNTRGITQKEYERFRDYIYQHAGISMGPHKQQLVAGRLQKRLRYYGKTTYSDYLDLVEDPQNRQERQVMVDLLTTNETYFYREPSHFEFLKTNILPGFRGRRFRVWSAASSSGEEAYTLAMIVAEILGVSDWQVMGSDISETVLEKARRALYPMDRAQGLPVDLLAKYCLKGVRSQAGYLLVEPQLKQRVEFRQINLVQPLPDLDLFDVVFLRNVLIYFDVPTKKKVVQRIIDAIKPGGYLFTSHVESLHGVTDKLKTLRPSVFQKPLELS